MAEYLIAFTDDDPTGVFPVGVVFFSIIEGADRAEALQEFEDQWKENSAEDEGPPRYLGIRDLEEVRDLGCLLQAFDSETGETLRDYDGYPRPLAPIRAIREGDSR